MSDTDQRDRVAEVRRAVALSLERWQELGVEDSQNGPVLPATIKVRRARDGGFDETPCMLMLLDNHRRYQARARARTWAADLGLDSRREGDGAQDADLVKELESFEELAYAIRERTAPFDQMFPDGRQLFARFRQHALMEIYGVLDEWTKLNDPRYGDLDAEQLWSVIAEISRKGHLLPLMGIDGRAQSACIALSARAALLSPMAPSHLRQRWTSNSDGEPQTLVSRNETSSGSSALKPEK